MKALEFQTRLNSDKTFSVPPEIAAQVPSGEEVRVVILLDLSEEDADWRRLTMEEFLKGYAESDSVYDQLPGG